MKNSLASFWAARRPIGLRRRVLWLALVLSGIAPLPSAIAQEPASPRADDAAKAELLPLVKAARESFAPIAISSVKREAARLEKCLDVLERYLGRHGADGRGWGVFLKLADLRTQIQTRSGPNTDLLRASLVKFRADHPTLDMPQFAETAAALDDYLHVARTHASPSLQSDADKRLELLEDELATLTDPPDPQSLMRMGAVVSWLERRWQAPHVVQAYLKRFSHPNLQVRIGADFIAAIASQEIDETAPVRDNILGTSIRGTGRTRGQMKVQPAAHSDGAAFDLVIDGVNLSKTVGTNGPAIIFATGQTELHGVKRITVNNLGLHAGVTSAKAKTASEVNGVATTKCGLMDKLIKRIAWKRIPRDKARGDRIAASHAERQFAERVDSQANGQLLAANRTYLSKIRNPLLRRGEFPKQLVLHTDKDALHVTASLQTTNKLAADRPAPGIDGRHALDVQIHESTIVNLAAGLLGGRTIRQEDVERQAIDLLGEVPPGLQDDEKGPWSITFAERNPVSLQFDDQTVVLTVRADGFTSEGQSLEAMDITLRYAVERKGAGFKAIRQGDPEVVPPNYVQGSPIPIRLNGLRSLLKERFIKLFPAEIDSPGIELKGKLARLGVLPVSHLSIDRGWLAVAIQMNDRPATTIADVDPAVGPNAVATNGR